MTDLSPWQTQVHALQDQVENAEQVIATYSDTVQAAWYELARFGIEPTDPLDLAGAIRRLGQRVALEQQPLPGFGP